MGAFCVVLPHTTPVAQNETLQLLFLKATKFIAYTYYASLS